MANITPDVAELVQVRTEQLKATLLMHQELLDALKAARATGDLKQIDAVIENAEKAHRIITLRTVKL